MTSSHAQTDGFNFFGMYKVLKGIQHLKSTYGLKQSELDEKSFA